jgi:TRAP-type C4-dicarboxylate transport system substrate-binding protein
MNKLENRPFAGRLAKVTLAGLVGVAASTSLAAADTVELRMASLAPTGSRWEKTLTAAADDIAKATENRVTVKMYYDAGQGDEGDYVRKIEQGQLDGSAVTSVGLAMVDSSIRVLELPRMFASPEEMDYVVGKMWKTFQKRFAKKGYSLGKAGEVGPIQFISKKEVKSLSDLKNQKVWRWGSDDVVKVMYKQLGVSGVPLGVPEVDAGLTSGTINACYGPPLAIMTLGWVKQVKYMNEMPMSFAVGATLIKQSAIDKIDKADYKKIEKIQNATTKKLKKNVRKDNKAAIKEMKRRGVTIVKADAAMISDFDAAAEKAWAQLVKDGVIRQDDLDKVLKHRAAYRAKKGK